MMYGHVLVTSILGKLAKEGKNALAIHSYIIRRRYFNSCTSITKWSPSIIKVSEHSHSKALSQMKSRLHLHNKNFGWIKQLSTTIKMFYY